MTDPLRYSLVALVVMVTHFQQGVTGFGCTVLALPLIVFLVGLPVAVPLLAIQGFLLALLIVCAAHRHINWREFGHMTFLMALGMPVGMWMAHALPQAALELVLAVFMLVVGIQGLASDCRQACAATCVEGKPGWLAQSLLPLGGIAHGAFASGGPLVVVYATRALTGKAAFRATLCLLWVALNALLIARWALAAQLTPQILRVSAFCVPFTVIGMVAGTVAHHRVDEVFFRRLVYAVLILSGLALAWSALFRK
jgi:uncharacterized membrane protein YfcA